MDKLLIALLAAALPASAAADTQKPKPPPQATRTPANPCAAFGPDFVPVEGGTTCIRVGGAISVGAGVRR